VFDQGLATTYSLGLDTLLTVPLQLALFDRRNSHELLKDGVAVLEALRRTSSRLSIYCQHGQIHVPSKDQVLFGMLEPIVNEVRAPGGGSFHAKVWVLRYVDPAGEEPPCLRVVVLSRNLTFDRSWDLSLLLEGPLKRGVQRPSRGLARLVGELPKMSVRPVNSEARDRASLLADEVSRTRFEPPENFEELSLHVHGLGGRRWIPPDSAEMAAISPFCDDTALQELAATTSHPIALVSRQEALDALSDETLDLFSRALVLDETAETEDGEDTSEAASSLRGLHAKAYIMKTGWDTRIVLGSANATRSGLLNGRNVELLAELSGKGSRVGKVEELLGKDGFGDILTEYVRPDQAPEADPAELEAERALDAARIALADAAMFVRCASAAEDGAWRLLLVSKEPVKLDGIADLKAWPITLSDVHAADVTGLDSGGQEELGGCALASITGLIAFEAVAAAAKKSIRFVLNLPLEGLPQGRDAAVMRTIISNQEGFLRYLALLLADLGEDPFAMGIEGEEASWGSFATGEGVEDLALLEHLVRALSREPERLRQIRRVVKRLNESEEAGDVIPPAFLALWSSFERALGDEP
jgi:hypothetical protein